MHEYVGMCMHECAHMYMFGGGCTVITSLFCFGWWKREDHKVKTLVGYTVPQDQSELCKTLSESGEGCRDVQRCAKARSFM